MGGDAIKGKRQITIKCSTSPVETERGETLLVDGRNGEQGFVENVHDGEDEDAKSDRSQRATFCGAFRRGVGPDSGV